MYQTVAHVARMP